MPVYSYTGLDGSGKEVQGVLEAESPKEVAGILRARSVFLLKAKEGEGADLGGGLLGMAGRGLSMLRPSRFMPVRSGDLIVFFRQLALMLRAGFTLVSALEASHDMQDKHRLRRVIKRLNDEIRRGESFSNALAKEKKVFPAMTANLVASGEQSGNLDAILERLAENLERAKDLKLQFITAMFYPCFILLSSLAVIVLMLVYVIPKFSTFLAARHAELPGSMLMLLGISDWFLTWGGPLGIVLGGGLFAVLAAYTTVPGKRAVDKVLVRVPVVGSTLVLAAMANAAWTLAMLLKSGVTAMDSLRVTSGVTGNLAVADCFGRAAEGLLDGRPLSKTFEQPHIPVLMRHMAAVGESSGQLDSVMQEVGEFYQKELIGRVKLMATMIEPVMILGVGLLVLFVYLALFQSVMAVSKGGM
ncbi:MAG: type II secretion system F family protein [Desulfobacter sp.]|nr:MAG: type II secretion system F family protein [Desulfobacter sp.]